MKTSANADKPFCLSVFTDAFIRKIIEKGNYNMRRVYDDTEYQNVADALRKAFLAIPADYVSEYDYGMYRAKVSKVKEQLLRYVPSVKFGNTTHAHGIGNNNAIEIVYTGNNFEEQICGLLHLIDDMYGGVLFYVTDIDGNRKTQTYQINGIDKRDKYLITHYRYATLYRGK